MGLHVFESTSQHSERQITLKSDILTVWVSVAGQMNITVSVPPGTTHHGESDLLCIPPKWHDYLVFLAANYLAHAITVVTSPGSSWNATLTSAVAALLLPVSGVGHALNGMWERAIFYRDPVTRAARAGALCMVVRGRGSMRSRRGQWHEESEDDFYIENASAKLQGVYRLQDGWHLVDVPFRAPVSMPQDGEDLRVCLSTPYNVPKLLIGLVQAIWATVTLYRARGDQTERFGYAAFGLTVAQYAYMSVINVVGNIVRPEYPTMFMIRTPLMDEAEQHGCVFSGELKVHLGESKRQTTASTNPTDILRIMSASFVCGLVPLAIVGALSGFQPQRSTFVQQLFTTWWLVASMVFGPPLSLAEYWIRDALMHRWDQRNEVKPLLEFILIVVGLMFFCVTPFVGGVVVVMMMIRDYGICTRIS